MTGKIVRRKLFPRRVSPRECSPHPGPIIVSSFIARRSAPGSSRQTIATRVTPELAEVEAAAESEGKTVAEWLRELALRLARQRPADPVELLLAELMVIRYALLNLFHATALANAEGKQLLPKSVLKIRDQADAQKLEKARKQLQNFLSQEGLDGAKQ